MRLLASPCVGIRLGWDRGTRGGVAQVVFYGSQIYHSANFPAWQFSQVT